MTTLSIIDDNKVNEIVESIRLLHETAKNEILAAVKHSSRFVDNAAAIGEQLLWLKARCAHGEFQSIVMRIGFPLRTAQSYMNAYRKKLTANIENPAQYLQLALEGIDYKEKIVKPSVELIESDNRGNKSIVRIISGGFFEFIDKKPVHEWDDEERDVFAADLAKRIEIAKELGIYDNDDE